MANKFGILAENTVVFFLFFVSRGKIICDPLNPYISGFPCLISKIILHDFSLGIYQMDSQVWLHSGEQFFRLFFSAMDHLIFFI